MGKFNKRAYRNYVYTQKMLQGSRRFMYDYRTEGWESTQNMVRFQCHAITMEKDLIESVLASTLAADGQQLGLGTYATDKYQYRWLFENCSAYYTLRNVGEHPMFLTISEVWAKQDLPFVGVYTNTPKMLAYHIAQGMLDSTAAGATSATSKTGDNVTSYTGGNEYFESHSARMHIKQSHLFRETWHISKEQSYKLNPGDDVLWPVHNKPFTWNPASWRTSDATVEPDILAGITHALVFKFFGVLGRGSSAGAHGTIGFLTSDLAISTTHGGSVTRLNNFGQNQIAAAVTTDDLTAVTLVGPGDVTLYDHVN